jgi:hypothetical protein
MAPEQARGERSAPPPTCTRSARRWTRCWAEAHADRCRRGERNARVAAATGRGSLVAVCALIPFVPRARIRASGRPRPTSPPGGVLASSCSGRTAAARPARWLEPIRARMGVTEAIDDLMGLCLVPVRGEGARTYHRSARVRETPSVRCAPPSYRRWSAQAAPGGGDPDVALAARWCSRGARSGTQRADQRGEWRGAEGSARAPAPHRLGPAHARGTRHRPPSPAAVLGEKHGWGSRRRRQLSARASRPTGPSPGSRRSSFAAGRLPRHSS